MYMNILKLIRMLWEEHPTEYCECEEEDLWIRFETDDEYIEISGSDDHESIHDQVYAEFILKL